MNELQIFNNEEFGQIRTVTINNEPWFVGKDVAEALGYERTADAIRQHVEEEDKLTPIRVVVSPPVFCKEKCTSTAVGRVRPWIRRTWP